MAQTAAYLVDHVIPRVPVRQWVLSLPIPLRLLLAAQPELVTLVLQVVHRVITRHLLGQAGLKAAGAGSGAVTLVQRFGSGVLVEEESSTGMADNDADSDEASMLRPLLAAACTRRIANG